MSRVFVKVPFYARTRGVCEYFCPACGSQQKHQVGTSSTVVIRCKNHECRRYWSIGTVIRPVQYGFKTPPRDHIFPPPKWIKELWGMDDYINENETGLPALRPRRQRHAADDE